MTGINKIPFYFIFLSNKCSHCVHKRLNAAVDLPEIVAFLELMSDHLIHKQGKYLHNEKYTMGG